MTLHSIPISHEKQLDAASCGEMYSGDVLKLLPSLLEKYSEQVQLIYLDPPFTTGQDFIMRMRVGEKDWRTGVGSLELPAYSDKYTTETYLDFMRTVLKGARELLSDTGVIFVHIDYRMSAHIRLLLDEVFGEGNFLNEIVWSYQTGGRAKKFFSRKHDSIYFYRKTRRYYFDLESIPISRSDTRHNHMKRLVDADGRVYRSIKTGGKVYTYYDDEPAYPGDVWDDVSHLQQKDPQRTGYDTQKPLSLLERIIRCASKEGDLVCDLFSGSGTTLEAAWQEGRRFLGADISPFAFQLSKRRLAASSADFHAEPAENAPEARANIVPGIAYYDIDLESYAGDALLTDRTVHNLDSIDGWAVGYIRDGVFVSMSSDYRLRAKPELKTTLQLPVYEGVPCIRISDVFGREFYYTFTNQNT